MESLGVHLFCPVLANLKGTLDTNRKMFAPEIDLLLFQQVGSKMFQAIMFEQLGLESRRPFFVGHLEVAPHHALFFRQQLVNERGRLYLFQSYLISLEIFVPRYCCLLTFQFRI